ncbi:MAG: hypothetical protein D6753_05040 [Planctomycetota bacterium]|nr:MAG: hypothetical protein D6753_05040 [Planctomycetota bacterium]
MSLLFRTRWLLLAIVLLGGYFAGRTQLVERALTSSSSRSDPPAAEGSIAAGTPQSLVPADRLLPDPWRDKLSVGERLALLDSAQQASGPWASSRPRGNRLNDSPALPLIAPIPVPPSVADGLGIGALASQSTGLSTLPQSDGVGVGVRIGTPSGTDSADSGAFSLPETPLPELPGPETPLPETSGPKTSVPAAIVQPQPLRPPVSSPRATAGQTNSAVPLATAVPGNAAQPAEPTIRIATFDLYPFDEEKLENPEAIGWLVDTLQQFDIVAVQGIQSERDDILPQLTTRANVGTRAYDYLIGPRVGRGDNRQQFAFLFDTRTVETDRFELYTVEDPHDVLTYEPLAAWFRCKSVPAAQAFTFSFVNARINPAMLEQELHALPALVAALAHDGRQEDDWVLAGGFGVDAQRLDALGIPGVRILNRRHTTDLMGTAMVDNLLCPRAATIEFTGRAGVFDFLREFNLSDTDAAEVAGHLPVWAEFSCWEGNVPGKYAVP